MSFLLKSGCLVCSVPKPEIVTFRISSKYVQFHSPSSLMLLDSLKEAGPVVQGHLEPIEDGMNICVFEYMCFCSSCLDADDFWML